VRGEDDKTVKIFANRRAVDDFHLCIAIDRGIFTQKGKKIAGMKAFFFLEFLV
jgi:hypothetical protein